MKFLKIFSVLAISAMTLNMFATETAKFVITFTSTAGFNKIVKLYEDDAVGSDFSSGNNAPYQQQAGPWYVNAWVLGGGSQYGAVETNSLEGLKIYFKANEKETGYTMSFSEVDGTEYFLQKGDDTDPANFIPMTSDKSFTCELNDEITFTIVKKAPALFYPREVANGSWGTICYPELIDSIQGAVVYEIAGSYNNATEIAVVEVAVADMVKGKPYIFQATAAAQKFFYNPDETDELQAGANGLTGTFVDATLGTDGFYVVKGQSFIPALGSSTVLANRAYLAMTDIATEMSEYIPQQDGAPVRFFSVVRGAATEDMQVAADGVKDGSYLINGRLVIVKDGKTYSAQGF